MKTEILNTVKEGLVDSITNLDINTITATSHLKNDLGLDSLSSMFFLTYLEDNLPGFAVNPDTIEARHFNTVESICAYIAGELHIATDAVAA